MYCVEVRSSRSEGRLAKYYFHFINIVKHNTFKSNSFAVTEQGRPINSAYLKYVYRLNVHFVISVKQNT